MARLLSGGNPQIAMGAGEAPVQAYIAAMPGWQNAIGQRMDALIARSVAGVEKAVKWNSPLYGVAGLVFEPSLLCKICEGRVFSRRIATAAARRRIQKRGYTVFEHP